MNFKWYECPKGTYKLYSMFESPRFRGELRKEGGDITWRALRAAAGSVIVPDTDVKRAKKWAEALVYLDQ